MSLVEILVGVAVVERGVRTRVSLARPLILVVGTLSMVILGLVGLDGQVAIPHETGQSVAPIFEGWYVDADGRTKLSFGYLNFNHEEEVFVPVGPNNRIEPGSVDQGQPTHFLARRHVGVFTVTLPEGASEADVVWMLTSRGQTMSVPATLDPLYQVYALRKGGTRQFVSGGLPADNGPPVLKLTPGGVEGAGPTGTSGTVATTFPNPVSLDVLVSDDGLPKRPGGAPSVVTLTWSKYRGPGDVTFSDSVIEVDYDTHGSEAPSVSAAFSEPGEYVLRVLATDGSRFNEQCCWTNGYVKVSVQDSNGRN